MKFRRLFVRESHADLMHMTHEVLGHHGFDYRNPSSSRDFTDHTAHQHWGRDGSDPIDHAAVKADLEGLGWKPDSGTQDFGHYTFERWDHPGPKEGMVRTSRQLKLTAHKERGTSRVEFA